MFKKILLLLSIGHISTSLGMFYKSHAQVARQQFVAHWRVSSATDAKMQRIVIDQLAAAKKANDQFYGYLSCGISFATFVGLARSYQNLHRSLISDNHKSTKQQILQDEATFERMHAIMGASLAAQTILMCRNRISKYITRNYASLNKARLDIK